MYVKSSENLIFTIATVQVEHQRVLGKWSIELIVAL